MSSRSEQTANVGRMRYALILAALWLVAIVGAIVVLEIALRIYTPFEVVVRGDRIVLPANREMVIENRPGNRSFRSSAWISAKLDPVIVHKKNSLGFRGPEPPTRFEDHLTIVTVGGSTTECTYLSDGKTWPDRLGAVLSTTFPDVWINNAGMDGHSTYGHTVLMEDHVAALRPKVTLFLIGINDLHASQPLEADRRVQRAVDFASAKRLLVSAANYSQLVAVALNLYRHSRAELVGFDYNPDFDLEAIPARPLPDTRRQEAVEWYLRRLPAYRERVANLIAISRRAGIEPVLLTQPVLYGSGTDDVLGVDLRRIAVSDVNGEVGWEVLEKYNDVTRAIGELEGVFVIDLAARLPKSSRYYYDFFHYTNEGAEMVAAIVHESLCPFLAAKFPEHARGGCSVRSDDPTLTERVPHAAASGIEAFGAAKSIR